MGSDTKCMLNSKWRLDTIKQVIESHLDEVVEVTHAKAVLGLYHFNLTKLGRTMAVITNCSDSPLGSHTWLSLRHNEEAIKIMKTVAKVLGGMVQENDCGSDGKDRWIEYRGKVYTGDALPYFVEYAIIHNEITGDRPQNIRELNESIHKWHDRIRDNTDRRDYNVYEREK